MVQPGTCNLFPYSVYFGADLLAGHVNIFWYQNKATFKQWAFWAIWAFVIMAQETVLPFSGTNPHLSPTVFAGIEKMPDETRSRYVIH